MTIKTKIVCLLYELKEHYCVLDVETDFETTQVKTDDVIFICYFQTFKVLVLLTKAQIESFKVEALVEMLHSKIEHEIIKHYTRI